MAIQDHSRASGSLFPLLETGWRNRDRIPVFPLASFMRSQRGAPLAALFIK
jgi:hypothetical protein